MKSTVSHNRRNETFVSPINITKGKKKISGKKEVSGRVIEKKCRQWS